MKSECGAGPEVEAEAAAVCAPIGLVYVRDDTPGIVRRRHASGFSYRTADGRLLRQASHLDRIRKLAIPPAYTDVWICPLPQGHLQATGRDARGRKQYRYHAEFRQAREDAKFDRMLEFGLALGRIRVRVSRDLAADGEGGVTRRMVLATLVRLLDTTLVRIGNDEYARSNKSFGLTTLRSRHAKVENGVLKLRFKGKSGVLHDLSLTDPRVMRVVRHCQGLPGQELFQYVDADGSVHCVGSADVNAYLQEASQALFTAKDFRTWHASAHALALLTGGMAHGGASVSRARINEVLKEVAERLRNTVAVCRKSYVHPRLVEQAMAGTLQAAPGRARVSKAVQRGLIEQELKLLAFLTRLQKSSSQ